MDVKYKSLGKNTILVFIGGAGAKLVNFAMLPLYTRWLSVSDYGLADITTVYATLLLGVVACCIYDAVFVLPKGASERVQMEYFSTAVGFVISMAVISALLLYIVFVISECFNLKGSFFSHIWYVYILVIAEMFFRVSQQYCRCINKMVVYSISGIVLTLSTALLSIVLIPYFGVSGYIYSMSFAFVIATIYVVLFSKSYDHISIKLIAKGRLLEMLKYSVPLIPNALMWWMVDALNRPIMEKFIGLTGIGIYAVASKFPSILSIINTSFMTSWQISVLDEFGKEGYKDFYNKVFRLTVVSLSAVLIIITVVSKYLIYLFTTSNYYEAWKYIPLLTLGVVFSNIGGFVGCNFSATRESKYYFYSSVWAALVAFIFNLLLIPIWGIWGAAISSLLSFAVMAISRLLYSWKYVRISSLSFYILLLCLDLILIIFVITEINYYISFLYALILIVFHVYSIKFILSFLKSFAR